MKTIVDVKLDSLAQELGGDACIVYFCSNDDAKRFDNSLSTACNAAGPIVGSGPDVISQFVSQYVTKGKKEYISAEKLRKAHRKQPGDATEDVYHNQLTTEIVLLFAPRLKAKFVLYKKGDFSQEHSDNIDIINAKLLQVAMSINETHDIIRQSLIDMGVVTNKTVEVVILASTGYSREEISAKLHLSVSGVDYYIESTKILFGAATLPELVYNVSQYGLLMCSKEELADETQ